MKEFPAATVEVLRGEAVESTHLVDVIIADADAGIHSIYGNADLEIYPRSSIKSLQALPLVESGAADNFSIQDKHLALACASHNGEPVHTDAATEMLENAGVSTGCLECGSQVPYHSEDYAKLVLSGDQTIFYPQQLLRQTCGFFVVCQTSGSGNNGLHWS